jgi:uncharacterized DUF497 family protein
MEFEWDEDKRLANLDKHGVDFLDACGIWDARCWIPRHSALSKAKSDRLR